MTQSVLLIDKPSRLDTMNESAYSGVIPPTDLAQWPQFTWNVVDPDEPVISDVESKLIANRRLILFTHNSIV